MANGSPHDLAHALAVGALIVVGVYLAVWLVLLVSVR
jgi:hypothetical protein